MQRSIFRKRRLASLRMFHLLLLLGLSLSLSLRSAAQEASRWETMKRDVCLFMANDMGRNGYYGQRDIARLMGDMADALGPETIIAAGDVHHFSGVQSTSDPLWLTNYELIYDHPELMIEWSPILGNHEYRGNTQAVLDYAHVSRRWTMPARYYTRSYTDEATSVRVVFLDTTPLITKYRLDTAVYPDACKQDAEAQLQWLDRTLSEAKEDWVIVVGHHPVYADTGKDTSEREDMQHRLLPLFRKHGNVDVYACGHIHNFQHISPKDGTGADYVVNSAASLSRPKVSPINGSVFTSGKPGFSVIEADKTSLVWYFVDAEGNILHSFARSKQARH